MRNTGIAGGLIRVDLSHTHLRGKLNESTYTIYIYSNKLPPISYSMKWICSEFERVRWELEASVFLVGEKGGWGSNFIQSEYFE